MIIIERTMSGMYKVLDSWIKEILPVLPDQSLQESLLHILQEQDDVLVEGLLCLLDTHVALYNPGVREPEIVSRNNIAYITILQYVPNINITIKICRMRNRLNILVSGSVGILGNLEKIKIKTLLTKYMYFLRHYWIQIPHEDSSFSSILCQETRVFSSTFWSPMKHVFFSTFSDS